MTREMMNRYRKLPHRTPEMLLQIVRKFYRAAVNHYDFIQRKKEDVHDALCAMSETVDNSRLEQALGVLFCEFHFYVTCWMQIEFALYRLAKQEGNEQYKQILDKHQSTIQQHLHVRKCLGDMTWAVLAQRKRFRDLTFITEDQYWFDGIIFSVNKESLLSLHQLYQEIMSQRV